MKAIFNREFKSYFTSMIGPVFVAALVLVTGIYFMVYNMSYGYPYFAYTLSASAIVFVLTVPLLTMRSFSEERHSKTDQLLLTSPVSVTQIVLGKFFSMAAVVAIPCVIFCLCTLIIKSTGTAYFLVDYSTILVYFLIGCAYVAIGMLISAMTESVIIAAVGTIITLLLINLSNGLSRYVPNTAIASLIGCLILLVLLCVIVYVMTKSNAATFGLLIGGAAVLIILYVINGLLLCGLISGISIADETQIGIFGVAYSRFNLVTLLPSLAVTIRRLHDTGKSGWNFLIALIPIIGALALIIWLSMPGNYYAIYRDGNIKSHNQ